MNSMPLCVYADKKNLAEYMYQSAKEGKTIAALLYYKEAAQLMTEIIKSYDIVAYDIDISDKESRGYDNLYVVSIIERELFVEPIYIKGKYVGVSGSIIYMDYRVGNDVKTASLLWNDDNTQYIKINFQNE